MSYVDILATATTVVGTVMALSYFIQIAKILKTKSAKDLSFSMFVILAAGVTLWTLYGLAIKNWPIVISFSVGVVGVYGVLILILKYGKK
jgi:MtN3 and saliva related transmembrane protein